MEAQPRSFVGGGHDALAGASCEPFLGVAAQRRRTVLDSTHRLGRLYPGLYAHEQLGRLLLGPFLVVGQFIWAEGSALRRGDRQHLAIWLWHLPLVALVLVWVVGVCDIPPAAYLALFVLPGVSLTLVRSFAEHKAAHTPLERTAIVEAAPPFALLFLNNNLHYAHHRRPDLPWHALPAYYRAHGSEPLEENGGLLYRGYGEILRRFLLRPVDAPVHPDH